jgi:hypothetical protein
MPANEQPPSSSIPTNAITKVGANIVMDQGVTVFVQQSEADIKLVNPVSIVVPNSALKQIVAQILLAEVQIQQMQNVKALPGNLPLPPGFNGNGRKAGG